MITFKHIGNFNKTDKFITGILKSNPRRILELYAKQGVLALASATPKDSGVTADSWDYDISKTRKGYCINWTNSNVVNGIPIVILIQYGHGLKNGAYVEGHDFINPAIRPMLDKIAEDLSKEVSKL